MLSQYLTDPRSNSEKRRFLETLLATTSLSRQYRSSSAGEVRINPAKNALIRNKQ
jgi:hypothetical protein